MQPMQWLFRGLIQFRNIYNTNGYVHTPAHPDLYPNHGIVYIDTLRSLRTYNLVSICFRFRCAWFDIIRWVFCFDAYLRWTLRMNLTRCNVFLCPSSLYFSSVVALIYHRWVNIRWHPLPAPHIVVQWIILNLLQFDNCGCGCIHYHLRHNMWAID